MVSLNKRQSGFTIVELLIVIVVIGILATLVIVTFTGIQQKARNSKRQTDVTAVASHLAAFYATNAFYPSLANLNNTTFRSANFVGLDPSALVDPKGGTLAAATTSTAYGYAATPSGCDDVVQATQLVAPANPCTGFTLTATLEGGGTFAKASN